MAITVDNIISDIQCNLNDESGQRVVRAEYIEMLNTIAREVARKTEIWIARYVATPNPNASTWSSSSNYIIGDIIVYNSLYYVCILDHTNIVPTNVTYWTQIQLFDVTTTYAADTYVYYSTNPDFYKALAATTGNLPTDGNYWAFLGGSQSVINTVTIPYQQQGVTLDPFRIIRVMRQYNNANTNVSLYNMGAWYDAREYSQQAILTSIAGMDSFRINDYQLDGRAFATQFKDRNLNIINGITLIFAEGFSVGDKVVIDYISGTPFSVTQWLNPVAQSIPEFLENPLKFGLMWSAFNRLFNRGDKDAQVKADKSFQYYQKYLAEAVYYAKFLKDEQSVITIQPNNFLAE